MSATTASYRPSQPTTFQSSSASSPFVPQRPAPRQKKTMSITQTYYLAHKARAKLSREAARSDHDLRLLVGHANLLDSLMLELADAEREQESWFNNSVRGAAKQQPEQDADRHVQWADAVVTVEDPEADWQAEDADSDSASDSSDDDDFYDDDEDVDMADAPLRRVASHVAAAAPSPVPAIRIEQHYLDNAEDDSSEDEDMMEEDDLEDDYAHLELVRTHSRASSSGAPPELDHDSDSSEDESMPPSPPTAVLDAFASPAAPSPKNAIKAPQDQDQEQSSFYSEGFYLPPRNPARLVSAISVY